MSQLAAPSCSSSSHTFSFYLLLLRRPPFGFLFSFFPLPLILCLATLVVVLAFEENLLTIAREFLFLFGFSHLFCFCFRFAFRLTVKAGAGVVEGGEPKGEGSLISIYNQVTKYHNSMFKVFITLWTSTTTTKCNAAPHSDTYKQVQWSLDNSMPLNSNLRIIVYNGNINLQAKSLNSLKFENPSCQKKINLKFLLIQGCPYIVLLNYCPFLTLQL